MQALGEKGVGSFAPLDPPLDPPMSEVQTVYLEEKRGVDFSCTISFGCIPSGSRCGNVPNELVHKARPPISVNHYCGCQYNIMSHELVSTFCGQ